MMRIDLLQKSPSAKIDAIVHIGAGHGLDVESWLDADASRIILVEPDPRLAADLRRRYAAISRVSVHETAIAGANGHGALRLFNFTGANSLRPSKRIFDRYPGLRRIDEKKVDAVGVNDFIRSLALKSGANNVLIVSAPGEESAIITALASIDLVRTFTNIIVRAFSEAFYDGWKPAADIAAMLGKAGFDVDIAAGDGPDPRVRAWRSAKVDQLAAEIATLEAALKKSDEALNKAKEESTAALQEFRHRQAMAAKEFARLEGQLKLIEDVLIRERLD